MWSKLLYTVKSSDSTKKCKSSKRLAGRRPLKMMFRSVMTVTKITLVCLNLWVLAVVLVVSLGHWRVFESNDPSVTYDNSHLIVMRELKEDGDRRSLSVNNNNLSTNLYPDKAMVGHSPALPPPVAHAAPASGAATQKPAQPAQPAKPAAAATAAPTPHLNSRVANLRHWCQQQYPHKTPYEQIPKSKLDSILVDERHKLLFCQIPGVAISDWRKIILILNGVVNVTSVNSISGGDVFGKYAKNTKRLGDYPDKERAKMLNEFYKVIFVRDPLERLAVSYRTKLVSKGSKYFHRAYGSPIIKKYRKKASAAEVKEGSNVRFAEFARYIIDNERDGVTALNEHWEQYYKQCHPCLVHYDFVGAFEAVEKDTDFVLGKIGAKKILKPPYIADDKKIPEKELTKLYSEMTAKELNSLFKIYSPDYTLFNYQCPNYVHELMKKENMFHDY